MARLIIKEKDSPINVTKQIFKSFEIKKKITKMIGKNYPLC